MAPATTRSVYRSSGFGAPSLASGPPTKRSTKRSKKAGPPEPAISAPAAPASSSSRASGPAATSNAARVSGRKTLRPSSPSALASAASRSSDEPASDDCDDCDVFRPYLSWNGYGVWRPSDGGKLADFTAFSTQAPVGVPANLPVTVAEVTLPDLPMTTFTIAIPCTLNSL